jgi:hypothetical protein
LQQLFLHFKGPATVLMQSRGAALSDVLTDRDVNEIADSPAGSVAQALSNDPAAEAGTTTQPRALTPSTTSGFASVSRDGAVKFDKETQ